MVYANTERFLIHVGSALLQEGPDNLFCQALLVVEFLETTKNNLNRTKRKNGEFHQSSQSSAAEAANFVAPPSFIGFFAAAAPTPLRMWHVRNIYT